MRQIEYLNEQGNFSLRNAQRYKDVYLPLMNEGGMISSVTPMLAGDCKSGQDTFLLAPASEESLRSGRDSRNFWIVTDGNPPWSVCGQSAQQQAERFSPAAEETVLTAGLLWQRITRENRILGIRASVLSFVPSGREKIEVMQVTLSNTGRAPLRFRPIAAVPLYGRSADNIRDHRRALAEKITGGEWFEKKRRSASEFVSELCAPAFCKTANPIFDAYCCTDFSEGYWCDHWTYNLDLIESYLTVFPEKKNELLFEQRIYRWYAPTVKLLPREKRYRMTENGLRQYDYLEISDRTGGRWVLAGKNEARSALIEKILLLCALKTATLDAACMGIEMEGGKPGWYDALNGLPGLLGSSMAETCELARLLAFAHKSLAERGGSVELFEEIVLLLMEITNALHNGDAYSRWDNMNNAKERYREKIVNGFSGKRVSVDTKALAELLRQIEEVVQSGIRASIEIGGGIIPTYFTFEASEIQNTANGIKPKTLKATPLPLFLEGPTRLLKLENAIKEKDMLAQKIRESDLYDKELQMYKVNAGLSGVGYEAGRAVAFTPGWLENESVWLHMEYKYLLELLKSGLYARFSEAFRNAAVPFLDPKKYGRSPLENVSFIASSANPDPSVWGRGYVTRLSGSTAEFLQIRQIMFFGRSPFRWDGKELKMTFEPFVPYYLMPDDGVIRAAFLGSVDVIYHAEGLSELTPEKTVPRCWTVTAADGSVYEVESEFLPEDKALAIRSGEIIKIDVEMREKT